ncbi:MAG TPA: anti-sigma factor [Candidatus Eisenbacteria bacterium]|nr:anti-sigma factor [Candidatus Eisenbacteria bacterium]
MSSHKEHKEEMIELCAAYALGTIEEKDRKRLEAHLAEGCPECETALREFGYGATLLAASAPRVLPLPGLRERALAAVTSEQGAAEHGTRDRGAAVPGGSGAPGAAKVLRLPRTGRPGWFAWTGWIVAAVMIISSGTFYESTGRLRAILRAREADLNGTARDLAVERQWGGVLTSPIARVADLAPAAPLAGETSGIRGRAVYDPATRRAVVVLTNATAPDSQSFQLWAVRGLSTTSMGVIHPDEHGAAVLRLESAGEPTTLTAFAVSLEPKGGSPDKTAPSGPVVLMGPLRESPRGPSRG